MLLVALGNLALMRRPKGHAEINFQVLIPARNEAENLPNVIPPLVQSGVQVLVYDDESTDGTANVATDLGATVVPAPCPLPPGWTGKNHACYQLSQVATAEWVVFIDADTFPSPDFAPKLAHILSATHAPVVSAFTRMYPGQGIEPAYLSWVPWILLASNPFGLVSKTKRGHNRFTNGQFTAWKRELLLELKPNEILKREVLEDVKIGRLLCQKGYQVEVIDGSTILAVQMYKTLQEAIDGMSKNSGDIMGNLFASLGLCLFLLLIAWGWVFLGPWAWLGYLLLITGKLVTDRTVGVPLWVFPLAPLTITGAALTIIRSLIWKRKGAVTWKGRTYS